MDREFANRILVALIVGSLCFMGYTVTSVAWAGYADDYDLTIGNIPVQFDGNKTLYLDTQTNDVGFVIYNAYLQVRSSHPHYYSLNITDGHANSNLVTGNYCYSMVASVNATLNNVYTYSNIDLSTDAGSVTVSVLKNTKQKIELRANSSNNASLNLYFSDLIPWDKYKFSVDGNRQSMDKANETGQLEYEFDGSWSSHTLTLEYAGYVYFNDFAVKLLVLFFILAIGAIGAVSLLSRWRRG